MTRDDLAALLEWATNALADIAQMSDIVLARAKANRVYHAIRQQWLGPGPDDDVEEEAQG
jgi:hypothetical protein